MPSKSPLTKTMGATMLVPAILDLDDTSESQVVVSFTQSLMPEFSRLSSRKPH